MSKVQMRELVSEEVWTDAFPVMIQLWEDVPRCLTQESFIDLIQELRATEDYRLFGLFLDEEIIALAGVTIRMSAWYGQYLWVYDLVTDDEYRSSGYGNRLLAYLEEWGKNNECERIALASALKRGDAHQFYENCGMDKSSFVFTKELE